MLFGAVALFVVGMITWQHLTTRPLFPTSQQRSTLTMLALDPTPHPTSTTSATTTSSTFSVITAFTTGNSIASTTIPPQADSQGTTTSATTTTDQTSQVATPIATQATPSEPLPTTDAPHVLVERDLLPPVVSDSPELPWPGWTVDPQLMSLGHDPEYFGLSPPPRVHNICTKVLFATTPTNHNNMLTPRIFNSSTDRRRLRWQPIHHL